MAGFAAVPAAGRPSAACSADCVRDVVSVTPSTGNRVLLLHNRGVRGWALLDLSARGRLVFTRGSILATAVIDGRDVRQVANGAVDRARLSPDGSKIVFSMVTSGKECGSAFELWIVDTTGAGLRKLSDCANYAQWAPDSRRIVFLGNYDGANSGTISIINVDGTGRHDLRQWAGTSVPDPVWSSRALIAYTAGSGLGEIRIIHASGDGPTNVIRQALSPAWAPNGRDLAYVKIDRAFTSMSLRVLDVYRGTQRLIDTGRGITGPSWSADGRLAYVKASMTGGRSGEQIYVKQRDTAARPLTGEPGDAVLAGLTWSTTGRRIFYERCTT